MRLFLISILLSAQTMGISQTFNADASTTGVVKTTDGKYEGTIDVNMKNDQVLWRSENVTKVFGARQIKEIELKMPSGEISSYRAYEFNNDHYIFLVISTGKVEILYKQGILKDQITNTYYPDYFAVGKRKELIPLEKKKDFISAFGVDAKWMSQYIKNNNLDFERVTDISKAFDYYNNSFEATHPSP